MEHGVRGGIRSGTPRRKSRRKPKGSRDERAFWRLERTGAGGARDARCLWKEPKRALVAAGKIEAASAVLDITWLHGRVSFLIDGAQKQILHRIKLFIKVALPIDQALAVHDGEV